jgi:hypothetical protein
MERSFFAFNRGHFIFEFKGNWLFKPQKSSFSGLSNDMWLITEPVSSGKCGKIISRECEWAFRLSALRRGSPMDMEKPHLVALSR